MEVLFHPTGGKCFIIEIGYFDTVLEIKEKIQNQQNIPVSKQTLIFNGDILNDELNVHHSNILDRSSIQILVEGMSPQKQKIEIIVKIPRLNSSNNNNAILRVRVYPDDTISQLKDEIHTTIQRLNNNNNNNNKSLLCVHANGVELHDHRTIHDCELSDSSEIDVTFRIRSSSTSSGSNSSVNSGGTGTGTGTGSGGTMKVQILVNGVGSGTGKRKIPLEVNHMDNVGELKKQLERLNELLHLNLPAEGYFFIHKQNVMDDDRSFRWHHVDHGDILEIFSGSISGGL